MDGLPLRGFLICPNCNRMLTGRASKGKTRIYYYCHCSSSCGVRFKAEDANNAFIKQLRYLTPKEGMVDVFIEAFINDFNEQTKMQNREKADLLTQIEAHNTRLKNALIQKIDGELDNKDYVALKKFTSETIEKLRQG
ncbi:zinc ribbon domain-containing protein [Chitinophaga sp.]|uniref:zinc ribbon domain-containing protein n=1 Tax=Chitinophaga sp. TaxID=1869181 RepID=UPI0031E215D0